jgi:two-component system, NtrC family, response regulator GlrR
MARTAMGDPESSRTQMAADRSCVPSEIKSDTIDSERIKRNLVLEIGLSDLIGRSPLFAKVLGEIKLIACSEACVLISGETGTGKDMCARAIHYTGARAAKPFVAINCGSVPDDLFENQFFGHERGAYTDARERSTGLIQEADGGTLFLDDIEALTLKNQVKLLRFLQSGTYIPVGGVKEMRADARVVAATNDDLLIRMKDHTFRVDLYYRLAVLTLFLPPLRERTDDISQLARAFLRRYAGNYAKPLEDITDATLSRLRAYPWPGNVRELENVIHRAVVHARGTVLTDVDLPGYGEERRSLCSHMGSYASFSQMKRALVADFEKEYVITMLQSCEGNVSEAARRCHKNRRAFWELMRKYHIPRGAVLSP